MKQRHKGKIVKVGTFAPDGQPLDWIFDMGGKGVAYEVDSSGTIYVGGYTAKELRVIADKAKLSSTN